MLPSGSEVEFAIISVFNSIQAAELRDVSGENLSARLQSIRYDIQLNSVVWF